MKIIIKSICVFTIILVLFSLVTFEAQCQEISRDVFRIHILANSDSVADQNLKLKVRDAIVKKSEQLLSDVHSKEDAMSMVSDNLFVFMDTARDVIISEGFDYSVRASVVNMYFNTRYYDSITMPSGFYDALRIEIGRAEGKNWWCVMYPSLCISGFTRNDSIKEKLQDKQYSIISSKGEYRVRFKIFEVFNGLLDVFF